MEHPLEMGIEDPLKNGGANTKINCSALSSEPCVITGGYTCILYYINAVMSLPFGFFNWQLQLGLSENDANGSF